MALLPDDWLPPLAEEAVELEALTEREQRMLRLAAPALREAVRELPSSQVPPLTLVLPEAPHGLPRATNDVSDLFLEGRLVVGHLIDSASLSVIVLFLTLSIPPLRPSHGGLSHCRARPQNKVP